MTLHVIGIMIVLSVAMITVALWPKKDEGEDAIKRRMTGRSAQANVAAIRQQAKESVAKRVVEKVAPIAVRPVMPASAEQMSRLRMKLSTAGFRSENGPTLFLASKTIVAILAGLFLFLARRDRSPPRDSLGSRGEGLRHFAAIPV